MSKHSKKFLEKKERLSRAEQKLRTGLDQTAEQVESKAMSALKIVGIAAVGLGVGFLVYKLMKSDEGPKKEEKAETKKASKGNSLVDNLTDHLTSAVVTTLSKVVMKAITNLLSTEDKTPPKR